jgi:hypothetical protein
MAGDERVRSCAKCKLNVYALEHLTVDEARALIRRTETGRVCARFYRRFDGTLLTKDCAKGFRYGYLKARHFVATRRVSLFAGVMVMMLTLGFGVVTLFSDNIRRLFGMSADGGMGGEEIVQSETPPEMRF